MMMIHQNGAT